MAPTLRPPEKPSAIEPPKTKPPLPPPAVCFSFAAYAKTLIQHIRSLNVDVSPGLTDREISALESSLSFSFPPDLRSILQAGLPVGTNFPDWRVGSNHHLRVLFNLPAFHLSKNVSRNGFWAGSWGPRPKNDVVAQSLFKKLIEHAPILVPVYDNCYVPSTSPNLAGNPVFQVDGNGIRVMSFDVAGFFEGLDRFSHKKSDVNNAAGGFDSSLISDRRGGTRIPPAWAATEARRVDFWTDAAETGRRKAARGPTSGWWSALGDDGLCKRLRACLDDTFCKLRDAGWKEDEVRDMMDGRDENSGGPHAYSTVDNAIQRIRVLSQVLSRAGWSREDVVYSLDLGEDLVESNGCDGNDVYRESCTEVRQPCPVICWMEGEDNQVRGEITTLKYLLSLEA